MAKRKDPCHRGNDGKDHRCGTLGGANRIINIYRRAADCQIGREEKHG